MGVVLQFPGGKRCRICGGQINPAALRVTPRMFHCKICLDNQAKAEPGLTRIKRLTMDDIARIMGYRAPR